MDNNQTIQLLKNHYSVRKYTTRQVPDEMVKTIVDCGQMAPTSSYFQSYTIIQVSDAEKRKNLRKWSGDQEWVETAPLALLFCADLHRIEEVACPEDKEILHNAELYTVAVIDCALAAQKSLIAAQALGLGGVIVGGIRNETEEVAKLFNLPSLVFPMFLLCLGYPDQEHTRKPRFPQNLILGKDHYPEINTTQLKSDFEIYEKNVYDYFEKITGGRSKRSWSSRVKYAMENKPRYNVGDFLKKAGFLKK